MELKNTSPNPGEEFRPDYNDVLALDETPLVATWHTHPTSTANLSPEDWKTFLEWPTFTHIIVGTDGVRFYAVKGSGVINTAGVPE